MAFDEGLGDRIRKVLGKPKGLTEKKMFGGLAFLLNGNMCVGVHQDSLIVRLDPTETDQALRRPNVKIFDLTGRPMKGWILVGPAGVKSEKDLTTWIDVAKRFAGALPPKK